jgi:hypothetical protein
LALNYVHGREQLSLVCLQELEQISKQHNFLRRHRFLAACFHTLWITKPLAGLRACLPTVGPRSSQPYTLVRQNRRPSLWLITQARCTRPVREYRSDKCRCHCSAGRTTNLCPTLYAMALIAHALQVHAARSRGTRTARNRCLSNADSHVPCPARCCSGSQHSSSRRLVIQHPSTTPLCVLILPHYGRLHNEQPTKRCNSNTASLQPRRPSVEPLF